MRRPHGTINRLLQPGKEICKRCVNLLGSRVAGSIAQRPYALRRPRPHHDLRLKARARPSNFAAPEGGLRDLDDAAGGAGGGSGFRRSGIGGGILFVPALIWLAGWISTRRREPRWARCWHRWASLPSWSTTATATRTCRIALLLAAGFLAGGYFGALGAQHISELWLRRIFALTLIGRGRTNVVQPLMY